MKANELRIGNYVQRNFLTEVVIGITANKIDTGSAQDFLMDDNFSPIPLTEEWLLKLGFKPHNGAFYRGSDLYINPDNGIVWIERNDNVFNNPALIKHVHSLQNIFFALTGQELTLNPL